MQEEEILKIEQKMLDSIDSENDLEFKLHEQAKVVSHNLIKLNKAEIEIGESVYEIVANINSNKMIIIASDKMKLKLLQNRYRPYIIGVDINNTLSKEANLSAAIEAWLRHKHGLTNIEELKE